MTIANLCIYSSCRSNNARIPCAPCCLTEYYRRELLLSKFIIQDLEDSRHGDFPPLSTLEVL